MPKFQTKQIVVEAELFDGSKECASKLSGMYASNVWPDFDRDNNYTGFMFVRTGGMNILVSPGDWIVTYSSGYRTAYKPDVFKRCYEAIP